MSETPLPIRLAQTIGITTSSVLAGTIFSASFTLVPRLLESPTPLLLRQWAGAYEAGKTAAPPFAALASACYFYLAYSLPSTAKKSKLYGYLVAAVLTIGIVPYTLIAMMGTNKKLLEKAEETKSLGKADELVEAGLGDQTAHKLLDRWGVLNLGRGVVVTAGSLVGAWTALN